MQQREYEPLCEAIRQKCADQHWYGPEFFGPAWAYMVAEDDPRRVGFEFPPATEEQLRETEAILGFPLPAVLRALYTRLANGGFGPAYGFRGIVGGAPEEAGTLAEWYRTNAEMFTLFDLKEDEIQPGKDFTFDDSRWPRSLLSLCNWGCGDYIGLDCLTGHILFIGLLEHGFRLTYVAASLEEWLQRWIRDELYSRRVISQEEALAAERLISGEQTSDFF